MKPLAFPQSFLPGRRVQNYAEFVSDVSRNKELSFPIIANLSYSVGIDEKKVSASNEFSVL